MTRQSGFKERVRARMSATGESYAAARAHLDRGRPSVLNVTNGESTSISLRDSGVPGEVLTYPGPLQEADRYVLWFEADLYDQLLLIEVLSKLEAEPARISLVSIGEYRGKAHFGGLGELTPQQLAALLPEAVTFNVEAVQLAQQAWRAYRASRPRGLPAIARASSPELRFLGEAFARLMQEYPSRVDGLSFTERGILQAVDEGAHRPREGHHLLLPAAQVEPAPLRQRLDLGKDGEDVLVHLAGPPGLLRQPAADLEVLRHRQVGEQPAVLGRVPDAQPRPPVRRQRADFLALESDLARAQRQEPDDAVDGGGLAGAVAAHQHHRFLLAHRQRNLAQDLRPPAERVDGLDLKHG